MIIIIKKIIVRHRLEIDNDNEPERITKTRQKIRDANRESRV